MKVTILSLLALLFILYIPITLKGKIIYDVFTNKGYLSLFLYKIKLGLFKIKFVPFKLIIKSKKKTNYLDLFDLKNQSNFGDLFSSIIIKKLKINNIRLYSNFGFNNDCQVVSIGSGLIEIVMGLTQIFISSKKKVTRFNYFVNPNYNQTSFMLGFTSSIKFNLITIIICFIKTIFILFNRRLKNGR